MRFYLGILVSLTVVGLLIFVYRYTNTVKTLTNTNTISKTEIAENEIYVRIRKISPEQSLSDWLKDFDVLTNKDPECANCLVVVNETSITVDSLKGSLREIVSHPAGRSLVAYIVLDNGYVLIVRYGTEDPEAPFPEIKRKLFEGFISSLKINSKELISNMRFTLPNKTSVSVYAVD
jgi:hypothetical protein